MLYDKHASLDRAMEEREAYMLHAGHNTYHSFRWWLNVSLKLIGEPL